jgi:hypothetical protein
VTTTFCFRNMSSSPTIQWSKHEQESGAVSFSKHLSELHHQLTTTTTTPTTLTPIITRSPVEKISHAVEIVVPQLVETLRHEFVDSPTTPTLVTTTTTPTTTPPSLTTPTYSADPPILCNPADSTQVRIRVTNFICPNCVQSLTILYDL